MTQDRDWRRAPRPWGRFRAMGDLGNFGDWRKKEKDRKSKSRFMAFGHLGPPWRRILRGIAGAADGLWPRAWPKQVVHGSRRIATSSSTDNSQLEGSAS